MRNLCGIGSGGGGLGHDEAQSTHEHAGLTPCEGEEVSIDRHSMAPSTTHVHRHVARNHPRIQRRKSVSLGRRVMRSIINLEWNEGISVGVAHEAEPSHRRTSRRSPIAAH